MQNLTIQDGSQQITGDLEVLGSINNDDLGSVVTKVATAAGGVQRVASLVESQVAGIADDGVITPAEKITLRDTWHGIETEYPLVRQRGVDAEVPVAGYEAAYEALRIYLYGEPGLLTDMAQSIAVDRAAYSATLTNYTSAREALVAAVGDQAFISAGLAGIILTTSAVKITRNRAGTITPSTILASAFLSDWTPYSGRFKLEVSTDQGATWTAAGTPSSADEPAHEFTVPSTSGGNEVTDARFSVYEAGAFTRLLRAFDVPVSYDATTSAINWGALTTAPSSGMIAGDYYFDGRAPASGGGVIRYWSGSTWVIATPSWPMYSEAWTQASVDAFNWQTEQRVSLEETVKLTTATARAMAQKQIVAALPAHPYTGYQVGDIVVFTSDKKLYRLVNAGAAGTGGWSKAVDGNDVGNLPMTAFAAGIRPPRVVAALPVYPYTGYLAGDTVVLNLAGNANHGKLFRMTNLSATGTGGWSKALDAADMTVGRLTAAQIGVGAVGADQIAAGAVEAEKLSVRAKNKVYNHLDGTMDGWTAGVIDTTTHADKGPTLLCKTSSNLQTYSSWFEIDPTKNYEVEIWLRADVAKNSMFFGLYSALANGTELGVQRSTYNRTTKKWSAWADPSTNPYFWYMANGNRPTSWVRIKSYVMGCNATPDDIPAPVFTNNGNYNAFRLQPTARQMRLRWLNYNGPGYGDSTETSVWAYCPRVTELAGGKIIADNIEAGAVLAEKIAVADLAASNAFIDALEASTAYIDMLGTNMLLAQKLGANQALIDELIATRAIINDLESQSLRLTGTLKTGAGAADNARVAIADQTGILSNTFVGGGTNDLAIVAEGDTEGVVVVTITEAQVGDTGPSGGKIVSLAPVIEASPSDLADAGWAAAVSAADAAVTGGKSDWSLPTRTQLQAIRVQLGSGIRQRPYWTNETSDDGAYTVDMETGTQELWKKARGDGTITGLSGGPWKGIIANGDELYLIAQDGVSVTRYNPVTGASSVLTPPHPVSYGTGCGESICFVYQDNSPYLEVYDQASGNWLTVTMPVIAFRRSMFYGNGKVYIAGVDSGYTMNVFDVYTISTEVWTRITLPFESVLGPGKAAVYNNKAYFGMNAAHIYVMDLTTDNYVTKAMPVSSVWHNAVRAGRHVVFFRYSSGTGYAYNIDNDQVLAGIQGERETACACGDMVYGFKYLETTGYFFNLSDATTGTVSGENPQAINGTAVVRGIIYAIVATQTYLWTRALNAGVHPIRTNTETKRWTHKLDALAPVAHGPIVAGAEYDTAIAIKIAWAGIAGHVVGNYWTLVQGGMIAISVQDPDGVEYARMADGVVECLIDTVSGGVTTKAMARIGAGIIESGDDANGTWYRIYGDGWAECGGAKTVVSSTIYNANIGTYGFSTYYGNSGVITYPVEFSEVVDVRAAGYYTAVVVAYSTSTISCQRSGFSSTESRNIYWHAAGWLA